MSLDVLVVTNMYPPHHYGGYELQCRDTVEQWRAHGHRVSVLTSDIRVAGVSEPPDEAAHGVFRDLRLYWRDHVLQSPAPWRRLRTERHNQRALRAAFSRTHPDVVSIWHMGGMSFGLLTTLAGTGLPLVYVVCDDWLIYGPRLDAWTRMFAGRRRLARLVARATGVPTRPPDVGGSGRFCFVSDSTRRRAEQASAWSFPRAQVVPSGIDRRDFPPAEPVPRPPWRWRLLYVGRIDPRKGIDTAVRALSLLPELTTLDLVGRGDEEHRSELVALASELGVADRIRMDTVTRSELAARYTAADALVFPARWDEPFGLVPIEAMACGLPVVATGTGGSAEFLVDAGNCLLFPAGDPAALAAAVSRLAEDEALRHALARRGLATADEYTAERMADTLETVHREAVGPPPPTV